VHVIDAPGASVAVAWGMGLPHVPQNSAWGSFSDPHTAHFTIARAV